VLEVGCGRGGGASYIARYLRPHRVVGIDLCHGAVRICQANHQDPRLAFLTGNAQLLPFRDASFDVVLNVESSHAYPSMTMFLQEAARVLRPGGFLVFADLRWNRRSGDPRRHGGLTLLKQQLKSCGLTVRHESDLSREVLQARSSDEDHRRASIRKHVPRGLRAVFAELAGLPGTTTHRHLQDRSLVYWRSVLQKPERVA
jgi:SAM-dependent methyltransferase